MWSLVKIEPRKPLLLKLAWLVSFSTLIKRSLFFENIKHFFSEKAFLLGTFINLKSLLNLKKYEVKNCLSSKNKFIEVTSKRTWAKSLIKSFLKINMWLPNPTLEVHQTFNTLYYYNKQSNIGIFNLRRVFNVWLNIMNFLNNIFIFNLNYIFFSSSYFKYENLALNWSKNKQFRNFWRFSSPFIFFLNNKTTLSNDIYFRFLKNKTCNLAFVIDIYYHKRTLHYLQKYKYITIGPVPISSNFYTLNVTFPVSSNSVFSNLFFIRLLFKYRKSVSYWNFKKYKQLNL